MLKKIFLTGSKDITLVVTDGVALAGAAGTGTIIADSSTGTSTIRFDGAAASPTVLSEAAVDVVEIALATAGVTTLTINNNSKLNLSADAASALTVGLNDNDDNTVFASGTLIANISEAQTTAVITAATVDTVILEATPDEIVDLDLDENGTNETSMTMADLQLDAATDVAVVQGSDNLVLTKFTVAAANQVLAASTMTGKLTVSAVVGAHDNITIVSGSGNDSITTNAVQIYDVQTGAGNDTINIANAKAGTKVTAGAGNDTVTANALGSTIDLGAGTDTVTTAGAATITLGADADNVKVGENAASIGVVVTDFVKGTDKITLMNGGAALVAIDVSDVAVTNGLYAFTNDDAEADAAGEWSFTLKNAGSALTATDMSDSIALSGVTLLDGSTNILGSLTDTFKVAATDVVTVTTGAGSDVATLAVGAATKVTIKDFTVGSDKIILNGAITTDLSVNLSNVTATAGVYTIGDATLGHSFDIENAGSDIVTEGNLTGIVQLGTSATATFAIEDTVNADGDVSVSGGTFNDFVTLTGLDAVDDRAIFNFSNNGGVDTVVIATAQADTDTFARVNFNNLTGIDSTAAKVDLAANAAKVADATNKGVYVFASSADGAGSAKITTFNVDSGNGYTQDVINAEVAAFINAGLGVSAGEKYVVVINDTSTTTYDGTAYGAVSGHIYEAYAYLVVGDADGVQAADITLIGMIDDGTSGNGATAETLYTSTDII